MFYLISKLHETINITVRKLFGLEFIEGKAMEFYIERYNYADGKSSISKEVVRYRLPFPCTKNDIWAIVSEEQKTKYRNDVTQLKNGYYTNKRNFITESEGFRLSKKTGQIKTLRKYKDGTNKTRDSLEAA